MDSKTESKSYTGYLLYIKAYTYIYIYTCMYIVVVSVLPLGRFLLPCFPWGMEMGGMRLKKPLPTTPPTRGPSVEAERVVDDRIFAGISEPLIPELRKKKDRQ